MSNPWDEFPEANASPVETTVSPTIASASVVQPTEALQSQPQQPLPKEKQPWDEFPVAEPVSSASFVPTPYDGTETPEVKANRAKKLRADGSKKGPGFLGSIQAGKGMIATEVSRGGEINGKMMEYPLLVPSSTPEEIQMIISGSTNDEIEKKAADHARKRLAAGLSPFKEGEYKPPASDAESDKLYDESIKELSSLPAASFYKPDKPEDYDIASDAPQRVRTSEELSDDFAWLDASPEFSDPAISEIVSNMATVYNDPALSTEEKDDMLNQMQQGATRIGWANIGLFEEQAKVEPGIREIAGAAETLLGDIFRTMAGAGTSVMAMGNAFVKGVTDIIPFVPKVAREWLEDNAKGLSEQSAAITQEVGKQGGLPARVAQTIGEQCLTTAIRLATLKGAGLAGSQSIIQNSVTLGLFTAATTPGSLKERTMAGVRSTTMMMTPVVAGAIPNVVLAKLADAALNTGFSHLYGFYDWKSPGTTAEKIARNVPSLLIDVLFASVTKPGQGAIDRKMLPKIPQAAMEGLRSLKSQVGIAKASFALQKAARHGGVPQVEIDKLAKALDVMVAKEDERLGGLFAFNVDKVPAGEVKLLPLTEAELATRPAIDPVTGLPRLTMKTDATSPVAFARKAVRTADGKIHEAQVIKKGVNKGQVEGMHMQISTRISKGDLSVLDGVVDAGYMGSDGKFYDQRQAEAIPGFLEPVGGTSAEAGDVTPAQTGVLRFFRGGQDPETPIIPAIPAVKQMKVIDPERPRYIAGEKRDKAVLLKRLKTLSDEEIGDLSPAQVRNLSKAIDDFDGSIEDLTPQRLGELLGTVKAAKPLKTDAEVSVMEKKVLHGYIAGTLYKSIKGAEEKKKQYLADLEELGIKGVTGLTDPKLTQENKLDLVKLASERYAGRQPVVTTAEETARNIKTISAMQEEIASIKGLEFVERGPGITRKQAVETKDFIWDGVKDIDPDGIMTDKFIDGLEYPLPSDPASRHKTLLMYQSQVRAMVKQSKWADGSKKSNILGRAFHSVYKEVRNYASRKLSVDKLARDTGNYKLFAVEQFYQATKKVKSAMANKLYDDMFVKTGVNKNIISYTSDKPALEVAIKRVQGIHPLTHDKEQLAARKEAEAFIDKDPRGAEIKKLNDATRELLEGESAINVRISQTREFGEKWDDVRRVYRELSSIPKDQRTPKQKKGVARIERMLSEKLPWRFNSETKKGEQVSIAEMEKAWSVLKQHNDAATREFLGKEGWGTREYYYMSTKNMDAKSMLRLHDIVETPKTKAAGIDPTIKASGAIEHRVGIPEFKEGSPWSGIRRHVVNLYVQAYAIESARYMTKATADASKDGYIDKQTADSMNRALESDMGSIGRTTDVAAKAMYGLTRAWWTAFGLIPSKMAWYTARNILYQGVPWGAMAGQYRGIDIAKAQVGMFDEWANPDSASKRHFVEDFNARVKLGRAVFHEGFLQFAHGEKSVYANKVLGKAQELVSVMFAASDNWNRGYTMFTGDVIIDKYLDKFVAGKISQAELEHGLKLEAMPAAHRRYLSDLFSKSLLTETDAAEKPVLRKENFKDFMRETSELKTLLANYPYSVTERSALEQNPDTRWFWGIPVYSRGTFEVWNETISKPMASVWNTYQKSGFKADRFDSETFRTAFGNLAAQILGRAIAMSIAGNAIGEKLEYLKGTGKKFGEATKGAYNIAESIFSWGPLGPGSSSLIKMMGQSTSLAMALKAGDGKAAAKALDGLGDSVLYYTFVIPAAAPILESIGDVKGLRNLDVIRSVINGKIVGGDYKERDMLAAMAHAIFDTEKMNRSDPLYSLWKVARQFLGASPEPEGDEWESTIVY